MKKIIIKTFICLSLLISVVLLPSLALAQTTATEKGMIKVLQNVGNESGFSTDPTVANPARIAGIVVNAFINFLGITFIILIVIAGYGWMTAAGNEEKIKKSVSTITQATIGLVVAISAWTLWNFVFEKLILGQ